MEFGLSDKDDSGQKPKRLNDPDKYFYSEGDTVLILATERLRIMPLPKAFKVVHPS